MIEWLIGASLLLLVASHAYLTYSCFTIKPHISSSFGSFCESLSHHKTDITTVRWTTSQAWQPLFLCSTN